MNTLFNKNDKFGKFHGMDSSHHKCEDWQLDTISARLHDFVIYPMYFNLKMPISSVNFGEYIGVQ